MFVCIDIVFLIFDDEDVLWGEKLVVEVIVCIYVVGVEEVVVKCGVDVCLVLVSG